jgi:hypothetical protein
VRKAFAARIDVIEKPMFGGLTFMAGGKMCCGVIKDELMIRLSLVTTLAELDSPTHGSATLPNGQCLASSSLTRRAVAIKRASAGGYASHSTMCSQVRGSE